MGDLKERYKSKKAKKYSLEDFIYDEERDRYTCPQGEELRCIAKKVRRPGGKLYRQYTGDPGYCGGCIGKRLCIRRKGGDRKHLDMLYKSPIFMISNNFNFLYYKDYPGRPPAQF